jgi:hypothetical protein
MVEVVEVEVEVEVVVVVVVAVAIAAVVVVVVVVVVDRHYESTKVKKYIVSDITSSQSTFLVVVSKSSTL